MNQLLQNLLPDIRYAVRQFRRSPGFTVAALITLTLGIGANSAIFTLVYGMLIRPLPVPHPEQLYRIGDHFECCWAGLSKDGDFDTFSYANYRHIRSLTPEFQDLAAMQDDAKMLTVRHGNEISMTLPISYVSGNYFRTFGAEPYLGNLFSDANDQPAAAQAAVLSYAAWEVKFGRDKSIVGSTVVIEGCAFRIVGVTQPAFFGEQLSDHPTALWIPLASEPAIRGQLYSSLNLPGANWLWLVGRVRPRTDIKRLQDSISATLRQWLYATPEYFEGNDHYKWRIPVQHVVLTKAERGIENLASNYGAGLQLLLMLSSIVLLITCVNIANLLLVRGMAHRGDLLLRLALGAPRSRITMQILTGNLLLAFLGGVLSLGVAYAGSYLALRLGFPDAYILPMDARPSWIVIGFTFLISLTVGVVFTLILANLSSRLEPVQIMRGSVHTNRGLSIWPQRLMLLAQVSLCLTLLTTATLAARSLHRIAYQNLGFDSENRYLVRIDAKSGALPDGDISALSSRIVSGLQRLGGVTAIGLADYGPFQGEETGNCIALPDHPTLHGSTQCGVVMDQVSPDFLPALNVSISKGRNFSQGDTASSPPVAIVSQAFTERLFPDTNPIGRHITPNYKNARTFEIVGIAQNFKFDADESFPQTYYFPQTQPIDQSVATRLRTFLIRFNHAPENPDELLRHTIQRIDPELAITSMHSLDDLIANSLSRQRLIAWLALGFAALALTLAAVGLYGVTAYTVIQRTGEIGIRMALGSARFGIIRLVLRGVFLHTGLGLLIGIPCALWANYGIRGQLYELRWYDPVSLISSVLILSICSLAAGLIPAYRAASIQPVQALRVE